MSCTLRRVALWVIILGLVTTGITITDPHRQFTTPTDRPTTTDLPPAVTYENALRNTLNTSTTVTTTLQNATGTTLVRIHATHDPLNNRQYLHVAERQPTDQTWHITQGFVADGWVIARLGTSNTSRPNASVTTTAAKAEVKPTQNMRLVDVQDDLTRPSWTATYQNTTADTLVVQLTASPRHIPFTNNYSKDIETVTHRVTIQRGTGRVHRINTTVTFTNQSRYLHATTTFTNYGNTSVDRPAWVRPDWSNPDDVWFLVRKLAVDAVTL